MNRFDVARDRHDHIVRAMRAAGMWDGPRPLPEAFESRVAFFGDTMSFDQWLRYVMLPNLEECIERRGGFPASSSLAQRAAREYQHYGDVPQAGPVVAALAALDGFVRLMTATVTSLQFFEAAGETPPPDQRRHANRFAASECRYIYWQLALEHPPLGIDAVLPLDESWSGPLAAGALQQSHQAIIKSDWRDSWHCHSHGWNEPGNWACGRYRVEIRRWDEPFAEGEFVVTEPGALEQ